MKKRSRQGLRRFQVEVCSYGNYVERIAELERALARKPRVLQIEIVGTGEIPADVALRFRTALLERPANTRLVTHAHSSRQGGSVLLWLLGERRTIRDGDYSTGYNNFFLFESSTGSQSGVWVNLDRFLR